MSALFKPMPQINTAKRDLAKQFLAAGLDTPDLDARLLLMAATGLSHADLIARSEAAISPDSAKLIANYAKRRLAGEPIDHILGCREFYGRKFKVTKDVLSPRPETELLVEAALNTIKNITAPRLLDLGTGSGAIIISILTENTEATGMAIDLSAAALTIAQANAQTHNVSDRLSFVQGSWFEPVTGKFDIILSNPPYITDAAMGGLSPEVANFDPGLALRGGADGLDAYRAIIGGAPAHLKPGGYLIFEIGYDQGQAVTALLKAASFRDIDLARDLAGHDRVIKAVY
jgi:release factor glutamine methyltransferase